MKQLRVLSILLLLLGSNAAVAKDSLNLSEINCSSAVNSKTLTIPKLKVSLNLSSALSESKAICQLIEWKGLRFIQVQYPTKKTLSYSSQQKTSRELEVFKIDNKLANKKSKNEPLIIENMAEVTNTWSIEKGHLLMRLKSKDNQGLPISLNGHIYDPKKNNFVDYQVFALRNGWDYKE